MFLFCFVLFLVFLLCFVWVWFFEIGVLKALGLEPVLEQALVDQVGLELTEICLPLPPQCWD